MATKAERGEIMEEKNRPSGWTVVDVPGDSGLYVGTDDATVDGAVSLRGWEHSKGANIEMDLIRSIGIPVMFEEQMNNDPV